MKTFTAVIEKCRECGLFIGYVPGFPGVHSQGETLNELKENLEEAIECSRKRDNQKGSYFLRRMAFYNE